MMGSLSGLLGGGLHHNIAKIARWSFRGWIVLVAPLFVAVFLTNNPPEFTIWMAYVSVPLLAICAVSICVGLWMLPSVCPCCGEETGW